LCPATHTPFHGDGRLNLDVVERQAAHLLARKIDRVFIGGTTGESASLTVAERLALGDRWAAVARAPGIKVGVHVGAQCLADAAELAAQAQRNQAGAVSMIAPSYFKPRTLDDLVASCAQVAAAAPGLPFYYYDIPAMTGIAGFPVDDFLRAAAPRIPNLAGVKYSNPDLGAYLLGKRLDGGKYDLPWGIDEYFLAALTMGAQGGVGSTYNFVPGPLQRMMAAFPQGDLATCQLEQDRMMQVIRIVARRGYMGCAKALMTHLGVPVGPARLPNGNPDAAGVKVMLGELDAIGFFSWKD
ncbi:MAG: dihydrodipicolinate synthase family protein, partial [Verrucomicrobiota bacterium]